MKSIMSFITFAAVLSANAADPVVRNYPAEEHPNGFVVLDVLETTGQGNNAINRIMKDEDYNKVQLLNQEGQGLTQWRPQFNFRALVGNETDADFMAKKALDKDFPWRGKKLNVTNVKDAELVAKILQAYVYEGWFERANGRPVDLTKFDTHFKQNDSRTWCHTPWLNISEKGREPLHGLTKEFPIVNTSVYKKIPEDIVKGEKAVTWGISYFNAPVCGQYKNFFRENERDADGKVIAGSMIQQIRNKKPAFESPDGSVAFKLLFNAMDNWKEIMDEEWGGAYNWYAHVSPMRQNDKDKDGDESIRKIMNVAHVQMDISLRDINLAGTKSELKNWIMTSYYYDKSYTNEFLADMKLPEPLRHMRPIGLQFGLAAGESHIFKGAENNHRPEGVELDYAKTRLNGPVDNIKSNCLGCHAQSGLNAGLPDGQRVPGAGLGFFENATYTEWFTKAGGSFDFNMQIDKAMRNFAKVKKQKINGPDPKK